MRWTIVLIRHEIGGGQSFGHDVNTFPIHDDAPIEKHCASRRASVP